MPHTSLTELLELMPEVAKAVNAFQSEAVQQQAFDALMSVAVGDEKVRRQSTPAEKAPAKGGSTGKPVEDTPASSPPKVKRTRQQGGAPSIAADLNLRPSGKQSFIDFASGKAPRSNEEKYTVAVFYMQHELGMSDITINHVYTAFKDAKWKVSADFRSGLRKTESRKGWLNTTDLDRIRLTPRGENLVEHDLPAADKGKK